MATLYTYAPILQEVQDACVQLLLPKPTGVYDSQDEHAILMGSYANLIGPMLTDEIEWQQFDLVFTVTGDGVKSTWDLPPGFSRFTNDTGWSLSNRRPVIIVNSQQWAAIQAWVSQSFFVNPACRIANDQLQFLVPPAGGEVITFDYTTSYWVQDGAVPTLLKERLTANSDVPLFDSLLFTIALKLKWLEIRGMPTTGVQNEFDRRMQQVTPRNAMAQAMSLNSGVGTGFRYLDQFNSPDTGLGM
jgi:hypothetical protein